MREVVGLVSCFTVLPVMEHLSGQSRRLEVAVEAVQPWRFRRPFSKIFERLVSPPPPSPLFLRPFPLPFCPDPNPRGREVGTPELHGGAERSTLGTRGT